jgi:hypothetical protein
MKKLLYLFIVFLLISCGTTKYIEVPVTKIEYRTQYNTDSIYVHDSINTLVKGDTIFKDVYKYIYKYKEHRDTIIVRDSIFYPVEVEIIKEVNKIYNWQKVLMGLGVIAIFFIIFKVFK